MNWYHELLSEFQDDAENSNAEIDLLAEEIADITTSARGLDIGASIVACQDLSRLYGLRGVFRVLSSKHDLGWVDLLRSYQFLAQSIRGRCAVRFANGTSLDNDIISELLMASVVFDNKQAQNQILKLVDEPSRYGVPCGVDSDFAMLGNAIATIIRGNVPSLDPSSPFYVLVAAESENDFLRSLTGYDSTRSQLSFQDESNYQHLENLPIAIFPLEVAAISKLRGWDLRKNQGSVSECFATPLLHAPTSIALDRCQSLTAIHEAFNQLDAWDLQFG